MGCKCLYHRCGVPPAPHERREIPLHESLTARTFKRNAGWTGLRRASRLRQLVLLVRHTHHGRRATNRMIVYPIYDCGRVWGGATRALGCGEADPAPCGGETATRSTRRVAHAAW
jgi:hypothetical protein